MTPCMGRLRRAVASTLAATTCLFVSGCVSIPHSSPISQGRAVGVQGEPQHVTNDPPGPQPGASALIIAQGFFAAMLAYPQTVTTAREYLTSRAAAHWDPGASVVVYDNLSAVEGEGGVTVSADALGRVDKRGSWSSVASQQSQLAIRLRLARVDGEWRIVNPPSGLYVDTDYFDSNYEHFSLYFYDPSRAVLAADPVYLVDDNTAATALVSDLVQGPTASLRGAVTTAVPRETKIDVAVSTSPSGLAEVPLSDDILKLSPEDRQLFAAQLAWTLKQLAEIHSVSISVGGGNVEIPGFGSVFGVEEFPGYDPAGLTGERRLFALGAKGLVAVSPDGQSPVVEDAPFARRARSAAIDTKGALAAFVSSDGKSVVVSSIPSGDDGEGGAWVQGATALLRPSWDFRGVLWVVDRTATGSRVYVATAAGQRSVRAPGLSGADIVSFGVSRDGVRFAAVVRDGKATRLVISVIHRDPQLPARVGLGPARTVLLSGPRLDDMAQLAWVSPTAVVMLANAEGAERQPWEVEIDGADATDVGQFLQSRPISLAAAASIDAPIAVGARGGRLYLQEPDLQWLQVGAGTALRMPVYAG